MQSSESWGINNMDCKKQASFRQIPHPRGHSGTAAIPLLPSYHRQMERKT